jgi:hypothetical protein
MQNIFISYKQGSYPFHHKSGSIFDLCGKRVNAINLTPLVPLSVKRRGGYQRGYCGEEKTPDALRQGSGHAYSNPPFLRIFDIREGTQSRPPDKGETGGSRTAFIIFAVLCFGGDLHRFTEERYEKMFLGNIQILLKKPPISYPSLKNA